MALVAARSSTAWHAGAVLCAGLTCLLKMKGAVFCSGLNKSVTLNFLANPQMWSYMGKNSDHSCVH